jgi:hypothetical protein
LGTNVPPNGFLERENAASRIDTASASDDVRELAAGLGFKYKQNANGMLNHPNLITVPNPEGEIVRRPGGRNYCKCLPLSHGSHDSIHLV